jgi:ABC-type transport system substrate-binding protein
MLVGCFQQKPVDGTTPGKPAIPTTPAETTPEETTPEEEEIIVPAEFKKAEYNTTTSVMPSNWNELTYADNNDTQIMSYIGSSFFDYDYKFEGGKYNKDGSINKAGIVEGSYTTNYSAATKLEDVTATVDAKWGYTAEQIAEGGYAWKITLRDDLKWDDGTPIKAADFVYSMQAQLDPEFMNFRGNTFYDTLMLKGSRAYFFSGAPLYAAIVPAYGENETPDYS